MEIILEQFQNGLYKYTTRTSNELKGVSDDVNTKFKHQLKLKQV